MFRPKLQILITFIFLAISYSSLCVTIAAGGYHTLVVDTQGKVWTYGSGNLGQLGHGSTKSLIQPTLILQEGIAKTKAVAAGNNHSLILDEEGSVLSFGCGNMGQLGHEDISTRCIPTQIQSQNLPKIAAISAGIDNTSLLDVDGNVWLFGKKFDYIMGSNDLYQTVPTRLQLPKAPKIIGIANGGSHVVLLDELGKVWTFGKNKSGQLGRQEKKSYLVPTEINHELPEIKSIAAGKQHSVLLDVNGDVWTFGDGTDGQLGYEYLGQKYLPTKIELNYLPKVVAIAAGFFHTLLLDINGNVWFFGSKEPCALEPFTGLPLINGIAAGGYHSVLLDVQGNIWTFGSNKYGQLGQNEEQNSMQPRIVENLPSVMLNSQKCQSKNARSGNFR